MVELSLFPFCSTFAKEKISSPPEVTYAFDLFFSDCPKTWAVINKLNIIRQSNGFITILF
jgi:hypothetical protein